MRTFDLAPLYRSTVGFDRLFSMLDGFEAAPGYPPYNIERTGENDYRISVAVAGFGESELSIESKENTLTIKGEKQVKAGQQRRGALPGHRGARFRAPVPACRLRPGEGRGPRERSPARRPRARDSRGEEAAPDRHRQRQGQAAGGRDQGCRLTQPDVTQRFLRRVERPGMPGRFYFGLPNLALRTCCPARRPAEPRLRAAKPSALPLVFGSTLASGLGFGSELSIGGAAAARLTTGLGFSVAGAARCGIREPRPREAIRRGGGWASY